MTPFKYCRVASTEEALSSLSPSHRPLAGGTDLLPRLKQELIAPETLVDIKQAALPRGIERGSDGLNIGALTTISELAADRELRRDYALLGQAAELTATTQIRNRATLGGNLLQRPRCWYYRNPRVHCWLKGGDDCPAEQGHNEHHALYGDSPCRAVHPSDLAGCLLALDASVTLSSSDGERQLALSNFFTLPEDEHRQENVIRDQELLTSIHIPAASEGWDSLYLKTMDRKVWAFALVGLAVLIKTDGDTIEDIRLVGNGLAPIPWRLTSCEDHLRGTQATPDDLDAVIASLSQDAQPLGGNDYKLDLTARMLQQALTQLLNRD